MTDEGRGTRDDAVLRPQPFVLSPQSVAQEGLMSNPELVTGTVKWFNAEKGFGFISTADHGDVFVHLRALAEGRTTLTAGEPVYFNLRPTEKGAEAANVRPGAPPPPKPALPTVDLPTPAVPGH